MDKYIRCKSCKSCNRGAYKFNDGTTSVACSKYNNFICFVKRGRWQIEETPKYCLEGKEKNSIPNRQERERA